MQFHARVARAAWHRHLLRQVQFMRTTCDAGGDYAAIGRTGSSFCNGYGLKETNMKGDKKIIQLLNKQLVNELTAINQSLLSG
jgi:hypothetical protein